MMGKFKAILLKNRERYWFLLFLIGLNFYFVIIRLLTLFHFLIPKPSVKSGVILYPYAAKGSDGYIRRFIEYLPYLEKDSISYELCDLYTEQQMRNAVYGKSIGRYRLYLNILRKRIFQVLKARKYETAFIQRGLFSIYFDLKHPYLEKLLRKLNKNITVDYWDAVFVKQKVLIERTAKYVDQISYSNEFIGAYFKTLGKPVVRFNIAINTRHYITKTDYTVSTPLRVIWTGLPDNLSQLVKHIPVLREIHNEIPLILVIVCGKVLKEDIIPVEHHFWEGNTFFKILNSADVGIYPEEDSLSSRGKSTMKVMDYLSTGLPMIGVPYGLPDEALNEVNMIVVDNKEAWKEAFRKISSDEDLRRRLGQNGLSLIRSKYSIESSYESFKTLVLKR